MPTRTNIFSTPTVYFGAAIYILLAFATLRVSEEWGARLFSEDKYFENMGALGFFVAAFVFGYGFVKTLRHPAGTAQLRIRQLLFLGLALLFLFGGGEEISWGQRIFGVQTPEALSEINAQGELNVHNIDLFEYEIRFELLFDLFWLSLTVLLPLAAFLLKPLHEFVAQFLPIPHWGLGGLFLFNYFGAKISEQVYLGGYVYSGVPFVQAVQEIKESNYALLFGLVALSLVAALQAQIASDS